MFRTADGRRASLLILVVAYHAEETLESVLDRIPRRMLRDFACEVLVVDDASTDRTFELGRRYAQQHPELPIRMLRNRVNQGYGGNQKVGYAYAIENGFDFVAMLHGDGQYAPESLPELMAPFADDQVGAVFGSRMMTRGGARQGGMPLYKYVGNRILTTYQNALLRQGLSEYHSGYRVYRVDALRRLRWDLNTNDFHFDTQIILQLLNADEQIVEVPIPTYYGDEISRVNGMKYAFDVMKVTLQFFIHKLGLRQQLRFDPVGSAHDPYGDKLGYPSSHQWAVDAVPPGSRVVDLGSGPGHIANALVAKGCTVVCVDRAAPEVRPPLGVTVEVADLDDGLTVDVSDADVILLLDVLEHLKDPEGFLRDLRRQLGHESKKVVVTTGNVAFAITRFSLLLGQFNYGASGILDRDHRRLFTFRTIRHLLRDAGIRGTTMRGIPAPFPKAIGDNVLSRLLLAVNLLLIRVSRRMFSFQIMVEGETTPDLEFLVRDAAQYSRECSLSA